MSKQKTQKLNKHKHESKASQHAVKKPAKSSHSTPKTKTSKKYEDLIARIVAHPRFFF